MENWVVEDDPSMLTTEEVESFHQALSTMTIQDTLVDDVINVNDIEDDCDDEVSKEHADDLLGVDEIGSIPSTFHPNISSMDTEEPNVVEGSVIGDDVSVETYIDFNAGMGVVVGNVIVNICSYCKDDEEEKDQDYIPSNKE
nr:uncharacterized protein LOC118033342 [Populus alba]